ncbi:MAG: RHS repeat-associated core domain-containing protein, partial [Acidimicrobiales bacterium]
VETERLGGLVVSEPAYDGASRLAGVSYPAGAGRAGNGTSLSLGRDALGRAVSVASTAAGGGLLASGALTRSQGGRVVDQAVDGTDAYVPGPNFTYDPAGRLTGARVAGHTLSYAYAGTGGCGPSATAGRNTNRTARTDNGLARTYCYDHADRLTSSSDPGVGAPTYDARGNTTAFGGQSLGWDGADRHLTTTVGATSVTYSRDATGRIVARTEGLSTTRYGYAGPGDSPAFTTNGSGGALEPMIALVGGVVLSKRASGDTWSYPSTHGDVIAVAGASGTKVGTTRHYDPDGTALSALPDNSAANMDYAWLGSHLRPLEHAPGLATIEMGARPYVPGIGRFLSVDPVEGGSCSDYDYGCGDPVNNEDLDGTTCGKRDRADKLVWEVKTQGIRANLRCGDAAGGWRHIKARGHVASLGWSDDFFKWAMQQTLKGGTATRTSPYNRWQFSGPIWQVFYDGSGNAYRREYDFTVITAKGGYVITAYGNYRGTVQCANPYCRGG